MTKSIRRPILGIMAASALCSAGSAASAAVLYEFTSLAAPVHYPGGTFSNGHFSVLLPDFVTTDTTLPTGSLSACTYAVSSASSGLGCGDHELLAEYKLPSIIFGRKGEPRDTVLFDVDQGSGGGFGLFHFFEDGAFSTPGVHETVGSLAGRLTVSVVPEPSQWMMLLLGLAGVGVARWRRAWQV
jgi:hypothetical protein